MVVDITVYPTSAYILRPGIPHSGPPPSDTNGLPHTRIIVEVAKSQSLTDLNIRCENTLLYGTTNATACTDLNLPAYQMTIPIEDVFWNFPIVLDSTTNTNVPNKTDYTITVPDAITVPNFIIDLFVIQQIVIECQRV
ncbi:unnamed protein product [Rhizophagus irregularis]|nr:unnamed protein product [Rhizophagus irregularis]